VAPLFAAGDELKPERPAAFSAFRYRLPSLLDRNRFYGLPLPLGDQGMEMVIEQTESLVVQPCGLRHDLM
jgi:hypothetical protein